MLEDVKILHYPPCPVVLNPWERAVLALLNTGWMPWGTLVEAAAGQLWGEHLMALLEQLNVAGLIDMEIRASYTPSVEADQRIYRGSRRLFRLACTTP